VPRFAASPRAEIRRGLRNRIPPPVKPLGTAGTYRALLSQFPPREFLFLRTPPPKTTRASAHAGDDGRSPSEIVRFGFLSLSPSLFHFLFLFINEITRYANSIRDVPRTGNLYLRRVDIF